MASPIEKSRVSQNRDRARLRSGLARKTHLRRVALEHLEPRTLMAVLPAAVHDPNVPSPIALPASSGGDASTPTITIDPINPNKLAAVWVQDDPTNPGDTKVFVNGAFSSNGGRSWFSFNAEPTIYIDPASGTNPKAFAQVTDPSVAFDRNENLYVLEDQHAVGSASGAIVLNKYSFTGNAPSLTVNGGLVPNGTGGGFWNQADSKASQVAILTPTLAVDINQASFTDPQVPGSTQTDNFVGNVYVAWTANTPPPPGATNWNPFTVQMEYSNDGGTTWSGAFTPGGVGNGLPQQNATPQIAVSQGTASGSVKGGQVTMVWDDFGSDSAASPRRDRIYSSVLTPNAGLGGIITQKNLITRTTLVDGTSTGGGNVGSNITSLGIGPAPVIASDNTLGAFSPHEGRLYVAYVDRINNPGNPADNTDIFLSVSDDGGTTWTALHDATSGTNPVNDDNSATDGFSDSAPPSNQGSNAFINDGRPQFEPSLSVDQSTGTLVVSFLDTRYDAARVRTATMIGASIDGGVTFSPQTFANNPLAPTDEITGKRVTLGPVPDNQSGGNPVRDANFGFGLHQTVAVANGRVYMGWGSNDNGGNLNSPNGAIEKMHIAVAPMLIAGGPRIISSTMGPVTSTTVNGTTFNNTFAADGTQQITGFTVTFDRRVDPASFTAAEVKVFYQAPTPPNVPPSTPPPAPVALLLDATTPVTALDPNGAGATIFFVKLAVPQSAVGTYSYSIGPDIHDLIRTFVPTTTVAAGGAPVVFNPLPGQLNLPVPTVGTGGSGNAANDTTTSTLAVAGIPANQAVFSATVTLTINHTFVPDLTISLIAPDGTTVLLANSEGRFGAPNFANYTGTTFSDSAVIPISQGTAPFSGSFLPEQALSTLRGVAPNGNWRLQIVDQTPGNVGTLINWSLTLQTGVKSVTFQTQNGNKMDQNANGTPGQNPGDVYQTPAAATGNPATFTAPYNLTTLPIIEPGPHVVKTVPVLGSTGLEAPLPPGVTLATYDGLVTNDTVIGLDVTFDRDMLASSFTPSQVLRILGPTGLITPPPGGFTVTPDPAGTPAALAKRVFRISFSALQLSGTYTVQLGSGIESAPQAVNNNVPLPLDTNLNAGLDELRGVGSTSVAVVYNAPSTQVGVSNPIPAAIDALTPSKVDSVISVPDNYLESTGLTLQLNISIPNDTDLSATLIAPDGTTRIALFANVGAAGGQQGFFNTTFSDTATTPIQNGGRPFFGAFQPQSPLGVWTGKSVNGNWTLEITNNSTVDTGLLNSWSLTFHKAVPSNGLGEPVADQSALSFRIFTLDPTNPLASNTWTAVGPASIGAALGSAGPEGGSASRSGRVGGIAVDPSDPSGNTVYLGGASGGIWKTTNFLTNSVKGPTWIPLTNFGPTFAINIGSIAVFGRNNDPNQSIIFASTGEGDTGTQSAGVLRSIDGGATWQLLDSTNNVDPSGNLLAIDSPNRDHKLSVGGMTSYKLVVDPSPTNTGQVIAYMAMSGPNGGIYRTIDTGNSWQRVRAGQATDVVLDPASGFPNAVSNPTNNLQIVYSAFQGEGVFISQSEGLGWAPMNGGVGDPFFQQTGKFPKTPVGVATNPNPNGAQGRIVLAKPALVAANTPNAAAENLLYEGWLYAAVVTPAGTLSGLYVTKDFGQNWTQIHLYNRPSGTAGTIQAVPTNDSGQTPEYDPLSGGGLFPQGNYDVSLVVNPTNPNVVYLGGTSDGQPSGLIRVDITALSDAHSFYMASSNPDGGAILANTNSPVTLNDGTKNPVTSNFPFTILDPRTTPYLNLLHDPNNIFLAGGVNSTFYTSNGTQYSNNGSDAAWIPFDAIVAGSTDQHRVVAEIDPTTGLARLIFGDDQGVFSGIDAGTGKLIQSIGDINSANGGNLQLATGARNGNLQITQFYYGAAQPSNLAAQLSILNGMLFGSAQDDGFPAANINIINDPTQPGYGNLFWTGPGGDGGGAATDQTGSGNVYQYKWPCCGGNVTDFFQVNQVGRTFGLVQQSNPGPVPDPQWPNLGVLNFAVNPLNGNQIIISSNIGNIFRTETQGKFWLPIAQPAIDKTFDGTRALALTYGAPDPNAPGGIGNLDNFIYVGTDGGHIYVTRTGGGVGQWTDISAGLDGAPIQAIVTDPTRSSHDAYAVTGKGEFSAGDVYFMADSTVAGATWQKITGNLFQIMRNVFGQAPTPGAPTANDPFLTLSTPDAIQADWRYVIPDNPANPQGSTHPVLYVGGNSGVYVSLDKGQSWSLFPDAGPNSLLNSPLGPGGGLPAVSVTDLGLSLGNIDPTNGRPLVTANSPNILMASTFGQGAFAIKLAPIVLPNSPTDPNALRLDPNLPAPGGSDSGISNTDGITNVIQPVIDGFSEQTAFGNAVTIHLIDETPGDALFGQIIGTGMTDASGHFAVQVNAGVFKSDGSTDGVKIIGVQAQDASLTKGNIATLQFQLLTTKPATPTAFNLDPASDSGLSHSDGITNVVPPNTTFDVTPSGPTAAAGSIELFRNGVLVNTVNIPAGVPIPTTITDVSPAPADGTYTYTVIQTDVAGNASPVSGAVQVTFDTVPPNNPAAPQLLAADDSGVKGDGITNVLRPHLVGTLVPEVVDPIAQVQIVSATGTILGTALSQANGQYSVQFASPLADGTYSIRVRAEDVAGNLSALSPVFTLQINNVPPVAPTIALLPSDDSGVVGDNITNVTLPHLFGTTAPTIFVDLIDTNGDVTGVPGAVIATTTSDSSGNYIVQFPPPALKQGVYHIQTQARDVAGNTSLSPVLTLTIQTTPPTTAPTISVPTGDLIGFVSENVGLANAAITSVRRPHLTGVTVPNGTVQIINATTNALLVTTTANASGVYTTQLPNNLNNGSIFLAARATDVAGNVGPTSVPFKLTIATVQGDYNNAGKADLSLFRSTATTGQMLLLESPPSGLVGVLGNVVSRPGSTLIPLQGDFDGDGKTDQVFYQPSTATWYIYRSQLGFQQTNFGQANVDIPVIGDYDGDGRSDLAVYRPTNQTWYVLFSHGGGEVVKIPGSQTGDIPAPGAYNGGGVTELAVYRPSTHQFIIQGPGGVVQTVSMTVPAGGGTFIPVSGDFDGDGKSDPALYQPSTGDWYIKESTAGFKTITSPFGTANTSIDIPVSLDYDGDGKTDIAVYRPTKTGGSWLLLQSTAGLRTQAFGAPPNTKGLIDIPVPEPLSYLIAPFPGLKNASVPVIGAVKPAGSLAPITSSASAARMVNVATNTPLQNATVTRHAQAQNAQDAALAEVLTNMGSVKLSRFMS